MTECGINVSFTVEGNEEENKQWVNDFLIPWLKNDQGITIFSIEIEELEE